MPKKRAPKKPKKHICPLSKWQGLDETDVSWFAVTLGGLFRAHARATSALSPNTVNAIFDQEKEATQKRWQKFVLDYLKNNDKV